MYHVGTLAPTGSTGNVSGASYAVHGVYEALVFLFVVEEVGASPTVTYKFQGSPDGENWFDVGYITDVSDTISSATRAMTAAGSQVAFLSNPVARRYAFFRVVTTGNNNVTFRAELYRVS